MAWVMTVAVIDMAGNAKIIIVALGACDEIGFVIFCRCQHRSYMTPGTILTGDTRVASATQVQWLLEGFFDFLRKSTGNLFGFAWLRVTLEVEE